MGAFIRVQRKVALRCPGATDMVFDDERVVDVKTRPSGVCDECLRDSKSSYCKLKYSKAPSKCRRRIGCIDEMKSD